MTYTVQNPTMFTAAYAGALAGLAVTGRQLFSAVSDFYSDEVEIANAWAIQFDTLWGSTAVASLEPEITEEASQAFWEERAPQALPASLNPATWAKECAAIIALIRESLALYTGQGYPNPSPGSGGGNLPVWPDLLWVDNGVTPTPSAPDGTIGDPAGVKGPYQNLTDAITAASVDRSQVALAVGSSDPTENVVVPPDFGIFIQQFGPSSEVSSLGIGGGSGATEVTVNALGGYGINALLIAGNFISMTCKGDVAVNSVTTADPAFAGHFIIEGEYPHGLGQTNITDNLGGGFSAAGLDLTMSDTGVGDAVTCHSLVAVDSTFQALGGATANIIAHGIAVFKGCLFASTGPARTLTVGTSMTLVGCGFSDTANPIINNNGGVVVLDPITYQSFLSNSGTFTNAANVRVTGKLLSVSVAVAVPTLAAGVSQYVNTVLPAPLATLVAGSPIAVNCTDDFEVAGAAGGFVSGAPRISATGTLRMLFVGTTTGANHTFQVTQLG